jgi:ribonuclease P protein component
LGSFSTKLPSGLHAQYLVAAPKRQFPKAPDRNRIKRLLREAIRAVRPELESALAAKNLQVAFSLQYIGKTIPDFHSILDAVRHLFNRYLQSDEFTKSTAQLPTPGIVEDLPMGDFSSAGSE